jgi:head-tail adaptor
MPTAGQRTELIVFQRATTAENDYGESVPSWPGTEIAQRRAYVRFGTAQEKREAAQEGGVQTATFECERSPTLETITLKDRISYLGSAWDITEAAPLDRKTIRFTATRNV